MNNNTVKVKNIGVIDLSEVEFDENYLRMYIPITHMSDKLQEALNKAIEIDKVQDLEQLKKDYDR